LFGVHINLSKKCVQTIKVLEISQVEICLCFYLLKHMSCPHKVHSSELLISENTVLIDTLISECICASNLDDKEDNVMYI